MVHIYIGFLRKYQVIHTREIYVKLDLVKDVKREGSLGIIGS